MRKFLLILTILASIPAPFVSHAAETDQTGFAPTIQLRVDKTWDHEGFRVSRVKADGWILKFISGFEPESNVHEQPFYPMEACRDIGKLECRVAMLDVAAGTIDIYGFAYPQVYDGNGYYAWGLASPYFFADEDSVIVRDIKQPGIWYRLNPRTGAVNLLADLRSHEDGHGELVPLRDGSDAIIFARLFPMNGHAAEVVRVMPDGQLSDIENPGSIWDKPVPGNALDASYGNVRSKFFQAGVDGISHASDFETTDQFGAMSVGRQSEGVYVVQRIGDEVHPTRLGFVSRDFDVRTKYQFPTQIRIIDETNVGWINHATGGDLFVARLELNRLPDTGIVDPPNRSPYRTESDPTVYGFELVEGIRRPVRYCSEETYRLSTNDENFERVVTLPDAVRVPKGAPCGGNPHDGIDGSFQAYVRYGSDPAVYGWGFYSKFGPAHVSKYCDDSPLIGRPKEYFLNFPAGTAIPLPKEYTCVSGIDETSREYILLDPTKSNTIPLSRYDSRK